MRRRDLSVLVALVGQGCFSPVNVGVVPSGEPCIVSDQPADTALYGAVVDGFSSDCPTWLRQKPNEKAILMFTGPAWERSSSTCRAADPWFQHTSRNWAVTVPATELDLYGDGVQRPTVSAGALSPPLALGYCLINEGEPDEYLVYSTCGIARLGPGLCEEVLAQTADHTITASWHGCPNLEDPRCAKPVVDHDCLPPLDEIDGLAHARYIDTPYFACRDEGDAWDSMVLSVGQGWDDPSFQCMSTQAWDRTDSRALQVTVDRPSYEGTLHASCANRLLVDEDGSSPPTPTRNPLGYCEVWPGTRYRYAIYSFCDVGDLQPEARCYQAWRTAQGDLPIWHDCPGGELCFALEDPTCGAVNSAP